jgi:hypothetical protein
MTDRKNIKLPESLFLALRDDKPDHMSWPAYFEAECLGPDDADDTATDAPDMDGVESALATIEERTGRIERQVEELGGGR